MRVCRFGSPSLTIEARLITPKNAASNAAPAGGALASTADGPQWSITAHLQPVIKKSQRVASQCGAAGPEIKRASAISRGPATPVTISGALSLWQPRAECRAFALSLARARPSRIDTLSRRYRFIGTYVPARALVARAFSLRRDEKRAVYKYCSERGTEIGAISAFGFPLVKRALPGKLLDRLAVSERKREKGGGTRGSRGNVRVMR